VKTEDMEGKGAARRDSRLAVEQRNLSNHGYAAGQQPSSASPPAPCPDDGDGGGHHALLISLLLRFPTWACYDTAYWAHDDGKGGIQFIKRKKTH
jgi:hypothetical protein